MSTTSSVETSAVNGIRVALGIGGVLAVIAGILIILQPAQTAAVVTWILAIYAVAAGLVYAGLGIFARAKGGWARVGHIVLGILLIAAGIVAFANLATTTALLAVFVAVFIGIAWIVEGIVSLFSLGGSTGKIWTIIFAAISIIAGFYLLLSPLWGAVVLWWVLGIFLAAMGLVQIVRAFTFKGE